MSLEYLFLHSRNIAHTKEKKQKKKEQVEQAEARLLLKHNNANFDSNFWRSMDVTKQGATIPTSNIGSLSEVSEDNHQLFRHDFAVQDQYSFMGFFVSFALSSSNSIVMEGTSATLARLYALVPSLIVSLRVRESTKKLTAIARNCIVHLFQHFSDGFCSDDRAN